MTDADDAPRASGVFRSLRHRNFRLYATGSILSNVGTWMQRIAQDWLVLQLTGQDPVALGTVTFLQFVPTLLLGMVGGVLADRMDKRDVLRITQSVVAFSAAVLGVLIMTDLVAVWQVYALALALGVANAIEAPSRTSIASELVPPEDLVNAVGLNSSSFNAARLVGPALSGVLIGWIGTGPVFLINALSSVWIIVLLSMIDRSRMYDVHRAGRQPGQIREALRYVRGRQDLTLIIALATCCSLFGLNLQVLIPLVSTHIFHQGAAQYGLLASALALGTLTGALLSANRKSRPRLRGLVGSALLFGLAEVAIAWVDVYWLFAVLLVPVGVVSLYFLISANSAVQLSVDSATRGRVMALYFVALMGTGAFGAPLVGWMTDLWGIQVALALCGALTALSAVCIGGILIHRLGGLRVQTHLHSRPHLSVRIGDETMIPYRREPLEEIT
ncbi:MFS transporter [Cumulibacter manganitolerans]|uniref:MFS transporter n=1 Tax=Cumulibacter manganitolerans TaxID=1884992 RepID=UPI0018864803|nr:MFS transporter [Cumulibacter manganitolerans]